MKALITGVGIVGKSTFRRMLKSIIPESIDIDGDYEEIPDVFDNNTFYIIEDVHGLTSESCLSIQNYDLVFYLLPTPVSHLIFWLKRMVRWFENGKGGWDKTTKDWIGNKKPFSLLNLPVFLQLLIHDFKNRRKWIEEDKKVLLSFKKEIILIRPKWTNKGIKFF